MTDFTFAHRQEGFDEHIDWSIRGYSNLLGDVISFSRHFVENDTNVVDIGCSTGKTTERMLVHNKDHCNNATYVGIEIAEGFYDNLDKRLQDLNKSEPWAKVEFIKDDVKDYKFDNCSLVTSIFTLQFMSKKDRKEVIQNIYNGLNDGGAFIFAEKIYTENAFIQDMLTFNYYDFKREKFDTQDIMDKEITLRHMLKPNTWMEIETMLKSAGFKSVQVFWQNFLFLGAIAIK
jgi:tRNA (cmo5U34)-methyltransferase